MTVGHIDRGLSAPGELRSPGASATALEVRAVTRTFGALTVLDGVCMRTEAGEVRALLGPNGAGKTTLLRILSGLTAPSTGQVVFHTTDGARPGGWEARGLVGLVPSGDRSFYLRLSGLENLVFFARLYGLGRAQARRRAADLLGRVGLSDAAGRRVGLYSQGMKRRLAAARALLVEPPVLLVDEATHDLDPDGARTIRELVRDVARDGTAVLWVTQRLDEIRGFADTVTVLASGAVRFDGTVDQLISTSRGRRYVVRLAADGSDPAFLRSALGGVAALDPASGDGEHYRLTLAPGTVLGRALACLTDAGAAILGCHHERSEVEEAFLALTASAAR